MTQHSLKPRENLVTLCPNYYQSIIYYQINKHIPMTQHSLKPRENLVILCPNYQIPCYWSIKTK